MHQVSNQGDAILSLIRDLNAPINKRRLKAAKKTTALEKKIQGTLFRVWTQKFGIPSRKFQNVVLVYDTAFSNIGFSCQSSVLLLIDSLASMSHSLWFAPKQAVPRLRPCLGLCVNTIITFIVNELVLIFHMVYIKIARVLHYILHTSPNLFHDTLKYQFSIGSGTILFKFDYMKRSSKFLEATFAHQQNKLTTH